jgi:UDP:flavonoid glycosyltransferase YjiC (YdhE family)
MRVLLASTAGKGHLGPLLPFAAALEARGDDVRTVVSDPPRDPRLDTVKDLPREQQTLFIEREWFGRICAEAARPAIEAACDEFRPELILREPCEYASAIAAVRRGLPFVTVAITNAEGEWGATAIAAPVLPDAVVDALRERPLLSRFPATLDPSPYPRTYRYAEEAAPESTHELVYATFGSEAARLGYGPYRALLDAVDGLDVEVLLTTGEALDLGPVPKNVRVERWVPQKDALARARLVVCHGGSGTVLGTLAAGLPLIILPLFADQATNGARLARVGAARVVEPHELRDAILDPPPPPLDLARELRAAPPLLTGLRRACEGIG